MNDPARTTDKRLQRGEASRAHILRAAVDCIAEQGLAGLTLDRVAERIGISRPLIVFHFKSKEKLIEEVLAYLGQRYSAGWDAIVRMPNDDAAVKLVDLIEYDIRFGCENPKLVSAWHAFWGDPRGSRLFFELVVPRDEGYAEDLGTLLARINHVEGYGTRELEAITRGLVNMMFGIWTQSHLNPGPNDFSDNSRAVALYLRRMFPRTDFPPFPVC